MVLRFARRFILAVVATLVIALALTLGAGAIALSIDWRLPRATEIGQPSSLFDRDGTPWYRFTGDVEHTTIPLEEMSPNLRDAVVATEDHRFYEHRGVDPIGVVRAVYANVREQEITQGASTLTQQYVKLTFVGSAQTLGRKMREAVLALQLEKDLTKDEILEAYLNRAYFGEGAYGAQAAALTFFNVQAADLTLAQAATIAAVLARPSDYSPIDDPDGALVRRDLVLDEMARYDFRSQAQVDAAKAEPLGLDPFISPAPAAPYLVEAIRRQLLDAYGADELYRGGLRITAAIELDQQFALEQTMVPHLPETPGFEPAAVVVDPGTGDVMAAWSGRDFGASQVDLALEQDYGRPSGSTFKAFALAEALEQGFTLDSRWPAPSIVQINDWTPRGGGCGGSCTLQQATAASINTVFAQVAREIRPRNLALMAERLGVRSTLPTDDLTMVLGTASVTALDMASAFGTLANDGVACPARLVVEVTDDEGEAMPPPDPRQPDPDDREDYVDRIRAAGWPVDDDEDLGRCYRAVAPGVARRATVALQDVVAGGTGRRADIGRPQAGKTGTTQDSAQVWFAGYTPDLAAAVMVSHRDGDIPLRNLPGCSSACFGGQLPARIWADIATTMLGEDPGEDPPDFPEPSDEDDLDADETRLPPRSARIPASSQPPPPAPAPAAPAPEPRPTSPDDAGAPTSQPPPPPPPPPAEEPEEEPDRDRGLIGELLEPGS